jgi:hypothetical protein
LVFNFKSRCREILRLRNTHPVQRTDRSAGENVDTLAVVLKVIQQLDKRAGLKCAACAAA